RNAMSLVNLLWVRNLFWDGRAGSLEAQAVVPLTDPHEMGQSLEASARKLAATDLYPPLFRAAFQTDSIRGEHIAKALAQFERTLISADAPYDRYLAGKATLSPLEMRGLALFTAAPNPGKGIRGANCAHCHGGPRTMVELFHNNGLDRLPADPGRETLTGRVADQGRFRVPTLRNIALTAPYMHDGRFATLAQVLDHYSDHLQESSNLSTFLRETNRDAGHPGLRLTPPEKAALLAFLQTLTDSTFIRDPRFANPHPQPFK
ncbi:MAG: c-type cytochrome, partial [Cytophagales bacterium]|nr:c-type cytochrome [Cytophagales bacterium]